jgi:hypothetical protein
MEQYIVKSNGMALIGNLTSGNIAFVSLMNLIPMVNESIVHVGI